MRFLRQHILWAAASLECFRELILDGLQNGIL